MTYRPDKNNKCTFQKMGKISHQLRNKKKDKNTLSSSERARKLSEWKKSWWK